MEGEGKHSDCVVVGGADPQCPGRPHVTPSYFSLRDLSVYSGLSVRTLHGYLRDQVHPLPHFRVGAKILVKRDDYDSWMVQFRRITPAVDVRAIVDDVIRGLR